MIHVCVCVSTCTEQPHIILHYSDSALSLMSLHIWSWAHVSFLDFKRLIKCQTICNHFPTTSLGLTTVDQGHLTVTHEHSCVHYHPSCALYACVCVCWSSTVWPDMHLNRSRGWGGPGVRNAKSYFPKPTRPHPAHARTGTHTHTHSHSHTVQTHMTTVTNRLSFQCVNSHLFPDNNNSYRSGG